MPNVLAGVVGRVALEGDLRSVGREARVEVVELLPAGRADDGSRLGVEDRHRRRAGQAGGIGLLGRDTSSGWVRDERDGFDPGNPLRLPPGHDPEDVSVPQVEDPALQPDDRARRVGALAAAHRVAERLRVRAVGVRGAERLQDVVRVAVNDRSAEASAFRRRRSAGRRATRWGGLPAGRARCSWTRRDSCREEREKNGTQGGRDGTCSQGTPRPLRRSKRKRRYSTNARHFRDRTRNAIPSGKFRGHSRALAQQQVSSAPEPSPSQV